MPGKRGGQTALCHRPSCASCGHGALSGGGGGLRHPQRKCRGERCIQHRGQRSSRHQWDHAGRAGLSSGGRGCASGRGAHNARCARQRVGASVIAAPPGHEGHPRGQCTPQARRGRGRPVGQRTRGGPSGEAPTTVLGAKGGGGPQKGRRCDGRHAVRHGRVRPECAGATPFPGGL